MKVLIAGNYRIPAVAYGGTERVMWWLGKALKRLGHDVVYLVAAGSHCPFAEVRVFDPARRLGDQIPPDIDVVHAQDPVLHELPRPFLVTIHANVRQGEYLDRNSVFISADHARRYEADCYVHHGIEMDEYGRPEFGQRREYVHFLGKAAWRAKNVRGAIRIARLAGERLAVLGGHRLNFKMGFRLTLDRRVRFHGMVGGDEKNRLLNGSKALLFPVLWHEPFGLAVVESLYFGCPVYCTPYGSLAELITSEIGMVSGKYSELAKGLRENGFSAARCHEYVCDQFTSDHMVRRYIGLYEKVMNGHSLNASAPRIPQRQAKYLSYEN